MLTVQLTNKQMHDMFHVLFILNRGGFLRFFGVSGYVEVYNEHNQAIAHEKCDIDIFMSMREDGLLTRTERKVIGNSNYSRTQRSEIYTISDDGRSFVSQ